MPDQDPKPPDSPEVRTIRQLVRLMHQFDLTAIDLSSEKTTIRIRRGRGETAGPAAAAPGIVMPPAMTPTVSAPTAQTPVSSAPEREAIFIRSPMVGTFYESPSPDAKPYITVGNTVRPDTTVCLIEAMKVFTEINAGLSGTIVEVLVKSGQPVEFDQPLFRVEPA
jgi:acetyl-CoA carboxylase biotin carboxyl carrier protein